MSVANWIYSPLVHKVWYVCEHSCWEIMSILKKYIYIYIYYIVQLVHRMKQFVICLHRVLPPIILWRSWNFCRQFAVPNFLACSGVVIYTHVSVVVSVILQICVLKAGNWNCRAVDICHYFHLWEWLSVGLTGLIPVKEQASSGSH
jgi:hypothetical protein